MVGYGNNKGILPVTCDELFKEIDRNKGNSQCRYQVMMMIMMRLHVHHCVLMMLYVNHCDVACASLCVVIDDAGHVFHVGDLQRASSRPSFQGDG